MFFMNNSRNMNFSKKLRKVEENCDNSERKFEVSFELNIWTCTRNFNLFRFNNLIRKTNTKQTIFFHKKLVSEQHFLMLVLREIYDYDKSLMPFFLTHTTKLQFFFVPYFSRPEKMKERTKNMYNHLLIVIIIRSVNGRGNEY